MTFIGAYFPRDRRIKFSERWRQMFDIDANGLPQTKKSILSEFISAGLQDITKDSDYNNVVEDLAIEEEKSLKNLTDEQIKEDVQFFMSYVDDLALQITIHLTTLKQYKNIYEIDGDFLINSCVKATNERIDSIKYERLKRRLNRHEEFLRKHFARKKEIRENINILKLVAFLVPLFIGLKRRMKIPDLNNLLPFMSGDEVRTERELPPLIMHPEFKSKAFDFNCLKTQASTTNEQERDKYFHLHGGVQFELETMQVNQNCAR